MSKDNLNPVEIDETDLEMVEGGLLLPAVQKVREAAARMSAMPTDQKGSAHAGGANFALGDGSVRNV